MHHIKYTNGHLNVKSLSSSALNIYITSREAASSNIVVIPDIPIPVNLIADRVQLDTLRVLRDRKELLFKIDDMALEQVAITDQVLSARSGTATPVIASAPMHVALQSITLDFDQPHAMRGVGKLNYSHFQVGDFAGDVKVSGSLTHYQLEGDFNWQEQILGQSRFTVKGFGDYDKATITTLDLQNDKGVLLASGDMSWVNEFSWNSVIYGKDVRTQKQSPQWSALVDFNIESRGSYNYQKEKWLMYLHLKSLKGELGGFPVSASGHMTLKDRILRADKIDLETSKNKLLLSGRITEPFDLKWDINARDISQLAPGIRGSVVGKGVTTGTTFAPTGHGKLKIEQFFAEGIAIEHADINLQAGARDSLLAGKGKATIRNLQYQDIKLAALDLDFDGKEQESLLLGKGVVRLKQLKSGNIELQSAKLDFNGTQKFVDLKGDIRQLKIAGQQLSKAKMSVQGALDNHRISVVGDSRIGHLTVDARGGMERGLWKGVVNKARLTRTETGNWILQKPVSIQFARHVLKGSEVCIVNPQRGKLCADTRWNADINMLTSKGRLNNVPLSQLQSWLPDGIDSQGVVNATYDIEYKQQGLFGKAEFTLPDSFILIETDLGKKEKLAYRNGVVNINFRGRKIDVAVSVQIDPRGRFVSQSTITLVPETKRHRIKGEATLDIETLAWAQQFFPDITRLSGHLSSKIQLEGLLSRPVYKGEIKLEKGRLHIPDTGTELSNITLMLKMIQPNQAVIEGSLSVKGEPLTMSGSMMIKKLNDWRAELKLKGNELLFMDTHEAQIYASPDLVVKVTPQLVTVNGQFHIPKARIRLSELPETAIYESDDVVFVGSKKKDELVKPLKILPNVAITLGEDVRFDGFGLVTGLKGNFHIGHNRNTIVSRGTLKIEKGEYRAYGQRLTIEHGILVFHGPISNPGLDIRATRRVDDIKVGINLAGTLQKPKSSIFSDPPLPESDALSYLVTGQSLSETSGDQAQLLVQAVRTLGITSGSTILDRMGGSVGLDDVNIITYGDYKKNKLQLGKRLGPKLYIRYITGLFDTFHKIAVDYKISSKWSLQAESGEEQGIDFIYNIDSD